MKHLRHLALAACLFALPSQGMSQTLPNNDFELWTVKTHNEPDSGWFTSNDQSLAMHDTLTVWKVPGHAGQAIHIQTAIIGTDTMFAYATNSDVMGVPYTGQPTNITGYYRYNLPGNDSAVMVVEFYQGDSILATNVFMIRNTTGSLSSFTSFSFPLLPMAIAPDSVFIAIASSNLMSGVGIEPASWIEMDQLAFTGTPSTVIVGGSFDSWTGITTEAPDGWVSAFGPTLSGISKSTTHYTGSFSAKLETINSSFGMLPGVMVNGNNGTYYTQMNDTLTGYYMYSETGGDSASVQAQLQYAGGPAGSAHLTLHPAATWTYFELPLNATSAPDTLFLAFVSGTAAPGTISTLLVDHLRFKSQLAGVASPFASNSLQAYPNPASTDLFIKMPQAQGAATVTLYDAAGRSAGQWNYNAAPATATIPVSTLASGVYIYEVRVASSVYKGNFVKK